MSGSESRMARLFAGTQVTLLAVVCLLLPVSVPGLDGDAFAGVGVLLAVVGTVVVASELAR